MSPSGASAWWPRPPRPAPTRGVLGQPVRPGLRQRAAAGLCRGARAAPRVRGAAARGSGGRTRGERRQVRHAGGATTDYWSLIDEGMLERDATGSVARSRRRVTASWGRACRGSTFRARLRRRPDSSRISSGPACCSGGWCGAAPWCGARFLQPGQGCGHARGGRRGTRRKFPGVVAEREEEAIRAATRCRRLLLAGRHALPGAAQARRVPRAAGFETTVLSEKSDPVSRTGSTVLSATYTSPSSRTAPSDRSCAVARFESDAALRSGRTVRACTTCAATWRSRSDCLRSR